MKFQSEPICWNKHYKQRQGWVFVFEVLRKEHVFSLFTLFFWLFTLFSVAELIGSSKRINVNLQDQDGWVKNSFIQFFLSAFYVT